MINNMRYWLNGFCILFCAVFILLGCTKPSIIFDLSAPNLTKKEKVDAQILIMRPDAVLAFQTNFVVAKTEGNQISYFDRALWSDELSKLVQIKIVEVFENAESFSGVGISGQGILPDYRVVSAIRSFHLDERMIYNENGNVDTTKSEECKYKESVIAVNEDRKEHWSIVNIAVKIIDESNRHVIASKSFCREKKETSKNVKIAVKGLNDVLTDVLKDIERFTVIKIVEDRKNEKS